MKACFHAVAVSLLMAGSAFAQTAPPHAGTTPDAAERTGLLAAANDRLLEQRAAGALLAAPVDEADRATLEADAASHRDLAELRAMDVTMTDHDIGVAVVTAAAVVLLIWIF